jgi:signal transduction histidine kinase/PAS domain-containing protein
MFKLTSISVILIITTAVNLFTTYISWYRRKMKSGHYFVWGMVAITFWTLAASLDYAADNITFKVLFAKFEAIGYHSAVALFTMFSFSFAGYDHWLRKAWFRVFFLSVPLINIILTWTNELHGWIWQDFVWSKYGENILIFQHGPGFTWIAVVGYLMIGIIVVNLWNVTRGGSAISRHQGRLLLLAIFIPIVSNLLYLLDIPQISGIDFTSITFSISGLIFLLALYGPRFLDLAPVARHTMIERMSDCILVLDVDNHIIDFNQSARDIWGLKNKHLGAQLDSVLAHRSEIITLSHNPLSSPQLGTIIHKDGSQVYDTRLTQLEDNRAQIYGKLIVSRNISRRYEIEQALHERVKELKSIYDLTLLVEKPNASLDEILQGSVGLIAAAMQYPHLAYARLALENKTYSTPNYRDTNHKLINDITVSGRGVGILEVGYLTDPGDRLDFLEEERNLLYIMAERVGNAIENIQADLALHENENLLRTIAENYPNSFLSVIEKDFSIGFTAGQEFQNQGLDPQKFIGLPLEAAFGENTPIVRQHYKKTFEGKPQNFELFVNGQYQLYRTVPLFTQDRAVIRILSVVENITARKELENELQDQQRTLAAFEERQKLARDLHDSVNQSIHSTVLFSETLTAVLEKDNRERATQIAGRLQESARQALKEIRLMLYELQNSEMKIGTDLLENLEYRLNNVERRAGVQAEVILEGSFSQCPVALHHHLFWIIIEALNNALKHAQGHNVQVSIHCAAQLTQVDITDDGIGFDPETLAAGGMGLPNMRQRANLISGDFRVESTLGAGTRVKIQVPH